MYKFVSLMAHTTPTHLSPPITSLYHNYSSNWGRPFLEIILLRILHLLS